jgi:hypothetical protein
MEDTCQHRIIIISSSTERTREPKPQYRSSRALSWEWNHFVIIVILHCHELKFSAAITGHLTTLLAPPPPLPHANIIGSEATYMESVVPIS